MSSELKDWLEIFANFAIIGAFVFAGVTFVITYRRSRVGEQIRLINDIEKDFIRTESELIEIPKENIHMIKLKDIQLLNVWERFARFVDMGELVDQRLLDHFRPALIKDYNAIMNDYQDIRDDPDQYESLKKLYRKWNPKSS